MGHNILWPGLQAEQPQPLRVYGCAAAHLRGSRQRAAAPLCPNMASGQVRAPTRLPPAATTRCAAKSTVASRRSAAREAVRRGDHHRPQWEEGMEGAAISSTPAARGGRRAARAAQMKAPSRLPANVARSLQQSH